MSSNGDTVPGLGFKDKEKALETIKNLEGRDADYQRLAVKGLIGRAKRTLQVTKAEDKLSNIKEALDVFERWLKEFEKKRQVNWSYLPLATVEAFLGLWGELGRGRGRSEKGPLRDFLAAYRRADGDYKKLRTVTAGKDGEPTWDIVRNKHLKELTEAVEESDPDLWDDAELPTFAHAELIMWAYSPDAAKIKKRLPTLEGKLREFKVDEDDHQAAAASKSSSKRKSGGGGGGAGDDSSEDSADEDGPEEKKKKKEAGVQGLGFKDREKALETVRNLAGRDPEYQRLVVQGLLVRARRMMGVTKCGDKLLNIGEAVIVFEGWMRDYERKLQRHLTYLPLTTVEAFAGWWGGLCTRLNQSRPEPAAFLAAYRACDGDHKKLRVMPSANATSPTWDIVRNKRLKELLQQIQADTDLWMEEKGIDELLPSFKHTELIMWAYSPDVSKIKKRLPSLEISLQKLTISGKNKGKQNKTQSRRSLPANVDIKQKKKNDDETKKMKIKRSSLSGRSRLKSEE